MPDQKLPSQGCLFGRQKASGSGIAGEPEAYKPKLLEVCVKIPGSALSGWAKERSATVNN